MIVSTPWFSLVFCTALSAIQGVQSRPWQNYAVELTVCQTEQGVSVAPEQCSSVCEPIRTAQEKCERGLACTCDAAPPLAVKACLECHLGTQEAELQQSFNVVRAISLYSELCGDLEVSYRAEDTLSRIIPESPDNSTMPKPLARREAEVAPCIFGKPTLTESLPPPLPGTLVITIANDRNLLMMVVFSLVVVLCIIERRRK